MKGLLLTLIATTLFAAETPKPTEAPKQPPVNFVEPAKPACTLVDGKLILAKMWPFGSWEECAKSILQLAIQLDQQKVMLAKELESLKALKK